MGRLPFLIVLALGAVVFYVLGYVGGAILCAIAGVYFAIQKQMAAILGVVGKLMNVPQEHLANCVLQYTFGLEAVLQHPAVDATFHKLQANRKAPAASLEDWRAVLMESYARKYAPATKTCEVTFNIKNNILFRNREVDFGDRIYHDLEIPYRWTEAGQPEERQGFMIPEIEVQLTVRMLVVNGMLLLQVGHFDKAYSPRILHDGSLAVYETHATLASFPLLYFAGDHGIPVRYLNLVSEATASEKERHAHRGDKGWKGDSLADWRELQQDIAAYRLLCDSEYDNYDNGAIDKLAKSFREKRERLLSAEAFKTYAKRDEDAWRYPDMGQTYWNDYATVFFRNMNANLGSPKTAHWFTDYYEEQP
jgi:hypothetical protein